MDLIASYRNSGFESVADGVIAFFDRRSDLQRSGVAFCNNAGTAISEPAKVSTDISLVAIDRTDPEAFALSDVIIRGVTAALNKYLQERPLFKQCAPFESSGQTPKLQSFAYGFSDHEMFIQSNR